MTPSISVQTTGPREWAIVAEDQQQAQEVRKRFSRRGLQCGPISQKKAGYAFIANVRQRDAIRSGVEK
jgi:hypothetical protein